MIQNKHIQALNKWILLRENREIDDGAFFNGIIRISEHLDFRYIFSKLSDSQRVRFRDWISDIPHLNEPSFRPGGNIYKRETVEHIRDFLATEQ